MGFRLAVEGGQSANDPIVDLSHGVQVGFTTSEYHGHMSPHDFFVEKLPMHPELSYCESAGRLRIEPPSEMGFAVELHSSEDKWTVYLGNAEFHETFDSAAETLDFMAWCYSGEARVREVWRGVSPEFAALEYLTDGNWREDSRTTYFFWRFWRAANEVILQNPNLLTD